MEGEERGHKKERLSSRRFVNVEKSFEVFVTLEPAVKKLRTRAAGDGAETVVALAKEETKENVGVGGG